MNLYKYLALLLVLVFHSLCLASVPSTITLGDVVYNKVQENVFGDHKSSEYIQKGETLNQWTSKVAVHSFVDKNDPLQFAQEKFGTNTKIEMIDGEKNNILQTFDTMNSIGDQGSPTVFQQNIWRYKQLNLGKGIIAIEYTTSKIIPNQTTPQATQGISSNIQDEIKSLPIEKYEF